MNDTYPQRYVDALNAEIRNLREGWATCALNASTHFDESRAKILALENHLRAVMEHIAPMLKLYEPNLPEHPVIAAIRDYLEKP